MERNYPTRNTDKMLKHLFDGAHLNVYDEEVVNVGVGAPGPDILTRCCEIFDKATSHRMKIEISNQGMLFQYGPTVGIVEARSEISKYLTDVYQSEVKREDIIVTTGATQGMHILVSTLLDLNGYIFVDEVTYMIALDALKQFSNLTIVPVKLNDDGTDIETLRALLIPTYHNPTGITFSDDVCKKLIKLAREFDILIACDDVYNTLYYRDDDVPKRLYAYDNPNDDDFSGNVISNGSFSKIIAPGLRFGWLEVPPRCKTILEDSGVMRSGGCLNNYTSGIMASMLELGLAQSQAGLTKELYKQRMLSSIEVLKNNLPASCSFIEPRGGYFIWIRMPENTDSKDFLKICVDKFKVFFLPGSVFSIENCFKNCFRIAIAFHQKEVLQDAVAKICEGLKEYLKDK